MKYIGTIIIGIVTAIMGYPVYNFNEEAGFSCKNR